MDSNQLSALSGVVLSLLCSYVPGLKQWYGSQSAQWKSLAMLFCLVLVSVGVYILSCVGWLSTVTCDQTGIKALVNGFISALVANQATYLISPQPKQS